MSRESRSPRKRSRSQGQDGKAQEQEDGSLAEDATSSAGFTSEGENGRKEQCSSCLELFCSEEIPLAAVSPQNSRILLTENQRVILSRALLVDLEEYVTQLSHISRIHAVVEFDRESRQYIVRDHSRNGTYVNGMRLPQAGSAILQHGDCILLLVKVRAFYSPFTFILMSILAHARSGSRVSVFAEQRSGATGEQHGERVGSRGLGSTEHYPARP